MSLRESRPVRRLSAVEAERLWRGWKEGGDRGARDRLVEAYVPLVKFLASRKVRELPAHCELDDLVSCGMVAVVEAVDRFDPAKGASFEQYAWMRVSGAIVDELRRGDRVSRGTRSAGRRIEAVRDRWLQRHGREPTRAEVAHALEVDEATVDGWLVELDRAGAVQSLDAFVGRGNEAEQQTLGDTVADGRDAYAARDELLDLGAVLDVLGEREREVLFREAAGEYGYEIGVDLGVTESRVSQIAHGAAKKLRKAA